jgi:hypothetical protein
MEDTKARSSYRFLEDVLPVPANTHTTAITPRMAEQLLEASNFGVQRKVRRSHVLDIKERMQSGEWTSGVQPIAFVFATKEREVYNINGQHTLRAISEIDFSVRMDIRTFKERDREGAAELFSFFDRQRKRSSTDNIQAFGLDEEFGLSQTRLGHISAAVNFIRGDLKNTTTPSLKMAEHVQDVRSWAPHGKSYYEATAEVPRDIRGALHRSPVLAVGLVTFRYQPKMASSFWYQVAWSDRIALNDPRRTLQDWLLRYNLTGGNSTQGHQISKAKMARGVERAWNYYFESGDEARLKVIQAGNKRRDLRLKGTPWDPDNDDDKPQFYSD